jgi:hypothetical protein
MSQLAHTRPRSATEIIDASFRFYRAHFGDLLVVSALLLVPPMLVGALSPAWLERAIQVASNWIYLICEGAIAVLVAAALEQNEALSAGEVLRRLGARAGSVIAVSILSGLMIMLGLVLFIVPGVIAAAWTMVALPVVAIEGRTSGEAISRSRALAKGQMLHVLGTMLLVWVIVLALVIGCAIAFGLVLGLVGIPERLREMIGALVMVPLFPLIGVATTMLYYDLRVRNEGADVSALIDALPEAQAGLP